MLFLVRYLLTHPCDALPQARDGTLLWASPPGSRPARVEPHEFRCDHNPCVRVVGLLWEPRRLFVVGGDHMLTHHLLTVYRASRPLYTYRRAQGVRKAFYVSGETRKNRIPPHCSGFPPDRDREELGVSTLA